MPTRRQVSWAAGNMVLTSRGEPLSCHYSVSICFVSSRSSRQRCMSAWSRQWRVSDQEDRTEKRLYLITKRQTGDRIFKEPRGAEYRMKRIGPRIEQTKENVRRFWTLAIDTDSLSHTSEVRLRPRKNSVRNVIERLQSVEGNMVVDSIEIGGQIEKGQGRHITTTESKQNIHRSGVLTALFGCYMQLVPHKTAAV